MKYRVFFSPKAEDDLRQLYLFIAARSGHTRAIAYLERIEAYCRGFHEFPERGTRRDDLLHGMRVVGFERQISIAFRITRRTVTFDRILYRGRNLKSLFVKGNS